MSAGWNEYEKLVLAQLDRLQSDVKELENKIIDIHGFVRELQIKSGFWGLLGGMISVAVMIVLNMLNK